MITSPRQLLHRIAQGNSPWVAYAGTKFEQRFDDPEKQFLVLYAGSSRLGCFIECLAHFRRAILPGFEELEEKFGPTFPQGAVPATWCTSRSSQSAKVTGIFADVAQGAWLSRLQIDAPAILLQELHAGQIDQSTIYQARFRPITQWVATFSSKKLISPAFTTHPGMAQNSLTGPSSKGGLLLNRQTRPSKSPKTTQIFWRPASIFRFTRQVGRVHKRPQSSEASASVETVSGMDVLLAFFSTTTGSDFTPCASKCFTC